jgi:hypothetical protein
MKYINFLWGIIALIWLLSSCSSSDKVDEHQASFIEIMQLNSDQ